MHQVHTVTYHCVEFLQICQADLALTLEDGVDILLAERRADIPLFNVPDAFGIFQPHGRNQGNIAKADAAEDGKDGLVGLGVEPLRLLPKVGQSASEIGPNSSRLSATFNLLSSRGGWRTMESKYQPSLGMMPLAGTDRSPSGYMRIEPFGSGSVLNASGISRGVPSNSVHGFQPSLRKPKSVFGPVNGITSTPKASTRSGLIFPNIW